MLFLFDILPLEDIIHETLMPMLDYESRIALNRCLAPDERYISRFSKDEILRHELYTITAILKYKLNKIEQNTGLRKQSQLVVQMLQYFEPKSRKLLILQHYPSFRRVVIQKLKCFSDPNSDDLNHATRYFRQKIRDLATKLLPYIKTIETTPVPMRHILRPITVKGF
jgi:hypothetical protein